MNQLTGIILAEIRRLGPISFARFMELALYFPELGYYERGGRVGRGGDFYTSASVGDFFGGLLAFHFMGLMRGEGLSQIVEAGANDGRLAGDILAWLRLLDPELAARVRYTILEPSPRQQESQRRTLASFGSQVAWASDWAQVGPVEGVVFSNELLDAMPTRAFNWNAASGEWHERGVGEDGGSLVWRNLGPPSPGRGESLRLPCVPEDLRRWLPDGFAIEASPAAAAWWGEAARNLRRGRLLAIDYGAEEAELLSPRHASGTLRAYSGHRVSGDVLGEPGERDITAHVNFTAIQAAGERSGLGATEFATQARFLTSVFEKLWKSRPDLLTPALLAQFKTLTHPEHLGRSFRALSQARVPERPTTAVGP